MITKTSEELLDGGGNFYNADGKIYFDAYTSTWQYLPQVQAFVQLDERGRLPRTAATLVRRPVPASLRQCMGEGQFDAAAGHMVG